MLGRVVLGLCLGLMLVGAAVAQAPAPAGAQPTVRVWNFSDYVSPEVLDAFERETGIKVVYDTFDNMEVVETRMLAGRTGYDVVVVTASFLARQIPQNLYLPLDRARLPNLQHQWPMISERIARYDPGNRFGINYMWGTTGIATTWRPCASAWARLTSSTAGASSSTPRRCAGSRTAASTSSTPSRSFPGRPQLPRPRPQLEARGRPAPAAELLRSISPFIRKFHSSEYINALATGEICLAVGYSGDILQARKRAAEAGQTTGRPAIEVNYAIPNEGALMWFDNFVIPRDAPNAEAAHRFIDFMLRPEMAARNVVQTEFASGNLAAQRLIPDTILRDARIYPDEAKMRRLYTITPFDDRTQRLVNRWWTAVKARRPIN